MLYKASKVHQVLERYIEGYFPGLYSSRAIEFYIEVNGAEAIYRVKYMNGLEIKAHNRVKTDNVLEKLYNELKEFKQLDVGMKESHLTAEFKLFE